MSNEIEAGEYVRTKYDGMQKVIKIEQRVGESGENYYYFNKVYGTWENGILKHSKDIIDLIKEGDILRYKLKGLNSEYITIVKKYHDARSNEDWLIINGYRLEQIEILEILTKEQYEQNCYKLKEEE